MRATPGGWPASRSHGLKLTPMGLALLYTPTPSCPTRHVGRSALPSYIVGPPLAGGLRAAGLRAAGLRAAGLRAAGLRAAGLCAAGLRVGLPAGRLACVRLLGGWPACDCLACGCSVGGLRAACLRAA